MSENKQKIVDIYKYNASGNTFIIFASKSKANYAYLARRLCFRANEFGGADGLIVLYPHANYAFEWDFYNNDGSGAFMCGNGARAAGAYAYANNLWFMAKKFSFLSKAGEIFGEILQTSKDENNKHLTKVKIRLPFSKDEREEFSKFNKTWWGIDTGVPHLVTLVDDINEFNLSHAKELRDEFDCNVNYMSFKDDKLYVRTFERGVEGETLACGTGMSACFLYARAKNIIKSKCIICPKSNDELLFTYKNGFLYFEGNVINEMHKQIDISQ